MAVIFLISVPHLINLIQIPPADVAQPEVVYSVHHESSKYIIQLLFM